MRPQEGFTLEEVRAVEHVHDRDLSPAEAWGSYPMRFMSAITLALLFAVAVTSFAVSASNPWSLTFVGGLALIVLFGVILTRALDEFWCLYSAAHTCTNCRRGRERWAASEVSE